MQTTILVAGVLNQPFGSWPAASTSNDGGITWTSITSPFAKNDFCTSLATDGVTTAIANERGYLAVTSNMANFVQVVINDGFGTTNLAQAKDATGADRWLAVGSYNYINGYGPYPPFSEVAQIYLSTSASSGWQLAWTHPNSNTIFYQIAYFKNAPIAGVTRANVWVAVGNNGTNGGDIWYSLDYGYSWVNAVIPTGVGIIYSVNLYQSNGIYNWYWGCNGTVFISSTLRSSEWAEIGGVNFGDKITSIVKNDVGEMILNGVNNLYISTNGLNFTKFNQPGYVFNNILVVAYNSGYRWIAFARSTLTQYTMWYTDNLTLWIPWNNGIEVQGSAAVVS